MFKIRNTKKTYYNTLTAVSGLSSIIADYDRTIVMTNDNSALYHATALDSEAELRIIISKLRIILYTSCKQFL